MPYSCNGMLWLKRFPRLLQKFDHVYAMATAGNTHSVLLRNDGQAVAFGRNGEQQCNIPALPAGIGWALARLDPRFVRSLLLGAVGGSLPPVEVLARVVTFLTRRVVVD